MVRSRWNRAFAGAALISAMWANGVQAGSCTLPAWASGSPLGAAVYAMAVTNCGAFIYSASGADVAPSGGNVNLFQRYDPVADTWTTLAPVPTAVDGATLACDAPGGRLFLLGGVDISLTFLSLVQVYTISTNTWSNGPSMRGPRAAMGSGVIAGKIYLVGGCTDPPLNNPQTQNWEFDPVLGTYTPKAPLPLARCGGGSGVSATNNRLYVVGGIGTPGFPVNTNFEYDPSTDAWATRAPLLVGVLAPGGVALSGDASCAGDLMIVGGENAGGPGALTQLYDVATNSWSSGQPLTEARSWLAAAQAGNTVIAVGGYNGSTTVNTVERIQGPPLPVALLSFSVE